MNKDDSNVNQQKASEQNDTEANTVKDVESTNEFATALKEQIDKNLRLAAEFENYKKRVRKDMDDAKFHLTEKLLKEFLPVIDNLERAIEAMTSKEHAGVLDGVKLVQRMFWSALEKFDVRPFEAAGEIFDPKRHEAVSQVESTTQPKGTVATVYQRGYTMGERVLRAAMVAVVKSS